MRTHRNWILIALLSGACSCAAGPQRAPEPSEFAAASEQAPATATVSATVPAAAPAAEQNAEAERCERPPRPLSDDGVFYVQSSEPASPRVRYLDGQVSLNDSCAIRRGSKLNRRVPPIYINGQPIGFC